MYFDANNLYGGAMVQHLPTGGIEVESDAKTLERQQNHDETVEMLMSIPPDATRGCWPEVTLEYPDELHDTFSDFPPAPEKRALTYEMLSPKQRELLHMFDNSPEQYCSVEKLVHSLEPKRNYVCHYRNLQLYLSLGMKLVKVHRIVWFNQSPWLKKYIDFNTAQRTKSTTDFGKDFFKLMNNAVFGKTMENVRNRRNVEVTTNDERLIKLIARPTFHTAKSISEDINVVENYKTSVTLDKTAYVGLSILEISKNPIVNFHYGYIKKQYPGPLSTLLFSDTDSLCYRIRTRDVYADMLAHADEFDWSEYPSTHTVFKGMCADEIEELRKRIKKSTAENEG